MPPSPKLRTPRQSATSLFHQTVLTGLRAITGSLRSPWDEDGEQGGRPAQLPPGHPRSLYWWLPRFWFWVNVSGRGAGKTRSAAELVFWRRRHGYGREIALVGQTAADVRDVIIEGPSGILARSPKDDVPDYQPSKRRLTWKNGDRATAYSGDEPGQLRGPNIDTAILDEFAKYKKAAETLSNVKLCLRASDYPCGYITTTPVPSPEMRALVRDMRLWEEHLRATIGADPDPKKLPGAEKGPHLALAVGEWVRRGGDRTKLLLPGKTGPELPPVVLVNEPMSANEKNLAPEFKRQLEREYEGTRLGRQELLGELLEDVEGALWTQSTLDASRGKRFKVYEGGEARTVWMVFDAAKELWRPVPDLVWVVVAVDPATTSGEGSDDTGIVVGALGTDDHAYVFEDATCHETPEGWASKTVGLYDKWRADLVVGEVNNGGDLVEAVLRTQDQHVSYGKVHASRGKQVRAQPVASLFEQGKVHLLGTFNKLEDEMTSWVPGHGRSPNRVDALVWLISKLMVEAGGSWAVRTARDDEYERPPEPAWVVAARGERG